MYNQIRCNKVKPYWRYRWRVRFQIGPGFFHNGNFFTSVVIKCHRACHPMYECKSGSFVMLSANNCGSAHWMPSWEVGYFPMGRPNVVWDCIFLLEYLSNAFFKYLLGFLSFHGCITWTIKNLSMQQSDLRSITRKNFFVFVASRPNWNRSCFSA